MSAISQNEHFSSTLKQMIALSSDYEQTGGKHPFPSWSQTTDLLENLRCILLMSLSSNEVQERLTSGMRALQTQIESCSPKKDALETAWAACEQFLAQLPAMRQTLREDVNTAMVSDPAVTSRDEVVFCYPGLRALTYYRVARALHELHVPLLPRLMTEIGHSQTGIDIHPGAEIGSGFFIDHGTGVVIGATCIIGNDVKIYQGVTLGARSFPRAEDGHLIKGIQRHPVIGDRVTIYAGATILGHVRIGADSVVGGNVWITEDVPAGSHVRQRRPRSDT